MNQPSLSSLAIGTILEALHRSNDIRNDLLTISRNLNSNTLNQLLDDPRATYKVIRAFHDLFGNCSDYAKELGIRTFDIDEAILRNQRYIQLNSGTEDNLEKYFIGLDDLANITSKPGITQDFLEFVRCDMPKGDIKFISEFLEPVLRVQPSNDEFNKAFKRMTQRILLGMDWSNVIVVGPIALTALKHSNSRIDVYKDKDANIINVFIYGVDSLKANEKINHIYDIWSHNLPEGVEKLVVRRTQSILFVPDGQYCRIEIKLELFSSLAHILSRCDFDHCAIGYDGSNVFMLPRCARALETGSTILTTDLIWKYGVINKEALQDFCVFQYAMQGFGIRLITSHMPKLSTDPLMRRILNELQGISEDYTDLPFPKDNYDVDKIIILPLAKFIMGRLRAQELLSSDNHLMSLLKRMEDVITKHAFGNTYVCSLSRSSTIATVCLYTQLLFFMLPC